MKAKVVMNELQSEIAKLLKSKAKWTAVDKLPFERLIVEIEYFVERKRHLAVNEERDRLANGAANIRKVRKALILYTMAMERKLSEHDGKRGKRGWKSLDLSYLGNRLKEEVEELRDACIHCLGDDYPNSMERVLDEAADVGNLAMMIADWCGALMPKSGKKGVKCRK